MNSKISHMDAPLSLQLHRATIWDTVGEFKSAEMGVPHMPAWKAKTLGKIAQEKVLLEL
jgi:hypothetical protein